MFSRSTAPAHCASGNDSMGRHTRCCPISSSACAGLNTRSAFTLVGPGLVDLDLRIEALRNALQLIDGGIVLLYFDTLDRVHGLLLLRRRLLPGRGDLADCILALELDARDVRVDRLVVFLD